MPASRQRPSASRSRRAPRSHLPDRRRRRRGDVAAGGRLSRGSSRTSCARSTSSGSTRREQGDAASIVEAARTLPMMATPRRHRAAGGEAAEAEAARQGGRGTPCGRRRGSPGHGCARGLRACAGATHDARPRRVGRRSHAPAVQAAAEERDDRRMLGAQGIAGTRTVDLRQVARQAEQLVKQAVADAGSQIEPAAARLVAERAGADIATLRGDVERLLLYAAGSPKITVVGRAGRSSARRRRRTTGRSRTPFSGATPPRRSASSGCRSSRAACPT